MTNKENLKKKIIYRSTHRGAKEMDILLGNFVKKHINDLNDSELNELEKILLIEDDVLIKWYFEKNSKNPVLNTSVSKILKSFKPNN